MSRTRDQKDKASVENTVAPVATWVIAGLRDRRFATLPELRAAIYQRVEAYNREPFQKRPGSRLSVFEVEEKPLLRPLPAVGFEISRWIYGRRVQKNGHVVWEKSFYSVPYTRIGGSVDLRVTDTMLEVFNGHTRLTSHLLAPPGVFNQYRTHDADLPEGPRYRQWDAAQWGPPVGGPGRGEHAVAQLGTCTFITRQQNVVFQGFTGSGKSYLGSALAKQACQHRYRAHYIRMPDLEEAWASARDRPAGKEKFLRKYAAFTLLVIDEWLVDPPDDSTRSMLLGLLERRYDAVSTVFCTQYAKKDWHQRPQLRSPVNAPCETDHLLSVVHTSTPPRPPHKTQTPRRWLQPHDPWTPSTQPAQPLPGSVSRQTAHPASTEIATSQPSKRVSQAAS
ncbi:ATP-binding protein [Tessaracoccus sp. OS52]|uniref:ATP-binding protein n=1 Tax=Tessaracoccus sp. OS52 TaxID=2886691 RepID=UPI001D119B9B|nr:ATP-binding protein [Tessaracoccus sp. OS52]MCC2593997.1 ATP-binding protein [Tessaracoccus sp. OS52]